MITEQDRLAAENAAADAEQDDLESSRIRHHENLSALTLKVFGVALAPLTEEERLRLAIGCAISAINGDMPWAARAELEYALKQKSPASTVQNSATVAALTQRNEDLQNTLMQALNAIELNAPGLARETLQKALRGEVAKTASEENPVPF